MDRILIRGGKPLNGKVQISGAKNAALPLMATCLLTDEPMVFESMPDLADITSMWRLLQSLGTESVHLAGAPNSLSLHCSDLMSATAPYDLVRKMRASVLVLCPLVARNGRARVSLPGGCAIGTRPINLHLDGLERMGARIELAAGYVDATAPDGLHGAKLEFPQPSVGATENLMMAATLADGITIISNAACEPEIVDLSLCLNAMGAKIKGAGTPEIQIEGVSKLSGCRHRVLADRIEAGTYAMAAGITGGRLEIENADLSVLGSATEALRASGLQIDEIDGGFVVDGSVGRPKGTDVMTAPFPGFATDLQAQFMALMCRSGGAAMITETIFENRFMHVPELVRMGADITVHGSSALVRGVDELHGAPVMATDLRASVSLVLAGLAAKGETVINRVYHLDRGYERLEDKLASLGADVERI